jgi:hypothetical protein
MAPSDEFRVASPTALRIGLLRAVELRIFDGDPIRALQGKLGARQQGEVSVGAKLRFYERKRGAKPSLGLQIQLIPANRRAGADFRAVLPALTFLATFEPGEWHIDLNGWVKMRPTDTGRCCDAEGLAAASFSRSFVDDRLEARGEVYLRGDIDRGELSEIGGDAGIIVHPTKRFALDAGLLLSHVEQTFVVAIIAGMSVRFGR